jgi:hypothetical protein
VARKSKETTRPDAGAEPKKPAPKRAAAAKAPRPKTAARKKSENYSEASSNGDRPSLVIVESPKKARSIN